MYSNKNKSLTKPVLIALLDSKKRGKVKKYFQVPLDAEKSEFIIDVYCFGENEDRFAILCQDQKKSKIVFFQFCKKAWKILKQFDYEVEFTPILKEPESRKRKKRRKNYRRKASVNFSQDQAGGGRPKTAKKRKKIAFQVSSVCFTKNGQLFSSFLNYRSPFQGQTSGIQVYQLNWESTGVRKLAEMPRISNNVYFTNFTNSGVYENLGDDELILYACTDKLNPIPNKLVTFVFLRSTCQIVVIQRFEIEDVISSCSRIEEGDDGKVYFTDQFPLNGLTSLEYYHRSN